MHQAAPVPANRPHFFVVMCGKGRHTLLFQFFQRGLEFRLVDAARHVMRVGVDVQCLAQCRDQMVLVELRVTLQRLVLDAFGDLAQLRARGMLEPVVTVGFCLFRQDGLLLAGCPGKF